MLTNPEQRKIEGRSVKSQSSSMYWQPSNCLRRHRVAPEPESLQPTQMLPLEGLQTQCMEYPGRISHQPVYITCQIQRQTPRREMTSDLIRSGLLHTHSPHPFTSNHAKPVSRPERHTLESPTWAQMLLTAGLAINASPLSPSFLSSSQYLIS